VGYQAVGTLGRRIVEGAEDVRIFGEEIAVGAHVWTTNGFSSHADQPILLDWIKGAAPGKLILVHGEDDILDVFANRIREDLSIEAHVAKLGETIDV
ncbi:MBL fold metallo-hydrolase, partial [Candidatus Bipolaricaulota bacterium]|nr:MBL fold metallo-hydrolase [Candidatus Bipolaricaulota bacterium]